MADETVQNGWKVIHLKKVIIVPGRLWYWSSSELLTEIKGEIVNFPYSFLIKAQEWLSYNLSHTELQFIERDLEDDLRRRWKLRHWNSLRAQ